MGRKNEIVENIIATLNGLVLLALFIAVYCLF